MGWLSAGWDSVPGFRLPGGDLKFVEHPTCDAYGCCSRVGGSSTALVLMVVCLPQGSSPAQPRWDEMLALPETSANS